MSQGLPPNPNAYRSLEEWARQFYDYYLAETRVSEENDPLPVLLAHQTPNQLYRATVDGVLMYDPATGHPVVSKNGEWVKLALDTP